MTTLKAFFLICGVSILLFSCKSDDGPSCVSCSSPQTSVFQVCQESDGNASVNGENTGTSYEVYMADLVEVGVSCGEN
ncbi:hypothetical protein [Ulvibacter litoralis]|uniref:Uncharacterized protein n=1 Tax=Ulvibacter litoralis TaxID=227084 RepID=A0A1G7DBA1_9FLAO|nr:hypothetical protein [Ulvibacter litoralis]GHC44182.1 hypothetical protein GCM10008083_03340 [Ulvibacter litoralis]SDE48827.1 hypothetical protein SAMN05421855_101873 [Ulvibacter litoralis]